MDWSVWIVFQVGPTGYGSDCLYKMIEKFSLYLYSCSYEESTDEKSMVHTYCLAESNLISFNSG